MRIVVEHLFRSPGHNYFGHHGRAPGTHRTLAVGTVRCLAGRGIEGDRFLDHKEDYKGQITFLEAEAYEAVLRELDLSAPSPGVLRRNVVTRGASLDAWIGREFEIQGVRFEGVAECHPCYWMDHALGPGAEDALRGRGGLRARILSDGLLRVGTGVPGYLPPTFRAGRAASP